MSACTPRRSSARKASMRTSISLCTRPFAFAMLTAGDRPSFVDMDQGTRERLIHSLSSWHFEPHKLPEEEIIACSYILFEALYRIEHLYDTVSVPLSESHVYTFLSLCCAARCFVSRRRCPRPAVGSVGWVVLWNVLSLMCILPDIAASKAL